MSDFFLFLLPNVFRNTEACRSGESRQRTTYNDATGCSNETADTADTADTDGRDAVVVASSGDADAGNGGSRGNNATAAAYGNSNATAAGHGESTATAA